MVKCDPTWDEKTIQVEKVDTNRNPIHIHSCSSKSLGINTNSVTPTITHFRYKKKTPKKPNTSFTATRNNQKSRYSHHITNHQLTTAILSPFSLSFSLSLFLSFYISLLLQPFLSHHAPWLPSHKGLFSPLPCFSPPLSSMLLSPGKSPTFPFVFITPTNPPCALACIQVNPFDSLTLLFFLVHQLRMQSSFHTKSIKFWNLFPE